MDKSSSRVRVEMFRPSRWMNGSVSAWILFAIDQAERIFRFAAEKDIRRDIEVAEDVQFLMNESDAEAHANP